MKHIHHWQLSSDGVGTCQCGKVQDFHALELRDPGYIKVFGDGQPKKVYFKNKIGRPPKARQGASRLERELNL